MTKHILSGTIVAFLIVLAGVLSSTIPGRAGFSDQQTYGGVSTCTGGANVQVLSLPNVGSMNDLFGVTISWKVGTGCTNTGPATVSVNGTLSQVNIYRRNGGALIQLGGGEMPAGDLVKATYDGTQFDLDTDYTNGAPVGSELTTHSTTTPPGYLPRDGTCVLESAYPALYSGSTLSIGSTYSTQDGCSSGYFGLPDDRGRVDTTADNEGGTAANRLNAFAATAIGDTGGVQGYMSGIGLTYLSSSIDLPGEMANSSGGNNFANGFVPGSGGIVGIFNGSVNLGGSSTAFPTFPNTQIIYSWIKT